MKSKKKTRPASKEHLASLSNLLGALPDTLLEVSSNGDILAFLPAKSASPPFDESGGKSRNISDLLPPQICSAVLYAVHLIFETQRVQTFEFQMPDGEEIRGYEMRVSFFSNTTALLVVRDITVPKTIERGRENLIHELEVKNEESETLRESMAGIVGTLEFSEIIENILDQIKRVVPYDSASIWRMDGRVQKLVAGRNLPSELVAGEYAFTVGDGNSATPILMGEAPYLLNLDVQNALQDFQDPPHNYIQSWLAIPLKTRGQVIGLIALDGREKDQFTAHHAELAVIFADQVAIALENSRLFSDLQSELAERQRAERALREEEQKYRLLYETAAKQTQELALIGRVRNAMAQALDRTDVIHNVVESIAESFGYTQVSLYLLEEGVLVMQHQVGYEAPILHIALDEGIIGKVARTESPVFLEDVATSPLYRAAVGGVVSEICIPLFDKKRFAGIINVESTQGVQLTEADFKLLGALSEHIGIALENSRLFSELQTELADRMQAESGLRQRETVLEAVTFAAELFLTSDDWRTVIDLVLERLGRALNTTHAYLFENFTNAEGEDSARLFSEWTAPGYPTATEYGASYLQDHVLQVVPGSTNEFLQRGESYAGNSSTFPAVDKLRFESLGIKALAEVPLMVDGRWWGTIGFDVFEDIRDWSHIEVDTLRVAANLLSNAIRRQRDAHALQTELLERKQIEASLRQRAQEISLLYQINLALTSPQDLYQGLRAFVKELKRVVIVDAFHIGLYDAPTDQYMYTLFLNLDEDLQLPPRSLRDTPGLTWEVISGGKTIYLPDISDPRTQQEHSIHIVRDVGIRSYIGIPLRSQDQAIGVMSVQSLQPDAYSPDQIRLLETLAVQVINTIEKERLLDQLKRELDERRKVEASLRQRESILEVVADAANSFLKSSDWREAIDGVLMRLGPTIDATHAYLFEDHLGPNGEELTSMRYEWTAPGFPSELDQDRYQNSPIHQDGFEEAVEQLSKGEVRMGTSSTFNSIEKPIMAEAGIQSILEVPIFVGGREWGAIGFNDFRRERTWNSAEVDALKIAANILGAAIKRQQDEHTLQVELNDRKQITLELQQRESILEVVADAANLFLKSSNWRDEIDVVLEKFGTTIHASHAFVFENHELSDGKVVSSMQFEWSAPSLPSDLHDPAYQNIPVKEDDFEDWYESMIAGRPYIGDIKRLNTMEMDFLLERGMKALLDFPVFVDGNWWGTIGFDDMDVAREWTNAEVGALLVAGNILGAAIQRQNAYVQLEDELTQRRQAERSLREREAMLDAMADAANRFLKSSDWKSEIDAVLERLGRSLNASHAYLFEKHLDPQGRLLNSLRYEWTAPGQTPDMGNPNFQNAPVHESGYERYYAILDSGEPFVGNSSFFTDAEKNKMKNESGIKALLEMRIVVNDLQWGTIGFDEMEREREWTPLEVEVIRVSANVLGAAIKRQMDEAALQSELAQRRKLIDELESKNAELERFTYTVSHDLKSPLFTIRGFLGYLKQDAIAGDRDRLEKDIQRIVDATDKMQQLLNDLLELSRIGRLMNEPREIDMRELTSEVLALLHGQIEARGVEVLLQENLPRVYGDRQRLTEVMQNLVDNAAKFMGAQPSPRIEIGTEGFEQGMPILFVRDNGVGIAPDHFDRIFGLFNKLDIKSDGTGIGLALVKRIIEVHGGRIWVESVPGAGSTFSFTLPAQGKTDSDYNQSSQREESPL